MEMLPSSCGEAQPGRYEGPAEGSALLVAPRARHALAALQE
jgi:hypothetical protein